MHRITFNESKWFTRPWHVQLAGVYGMYRLGVVQLEHTLRYSSVSICDYIKHMLIGAIVVAISTFLIIVVLYPFVSAAALVTTSLIVGLPLTIDRELVGAMAFFGAVIALLGSVWAMTTYSDRPADHGFNLNYYPPQRKRFATIRSVYQAIVNKICVPIGYRRVD
jgi:hypothetical protein